ncbi:MAG: hypothetical protein ACFCVH_11910 [Alphaproteobacteria bacterium]
MAKASKTSEAPRIALDQIEDAMAKSGVQGDALRADGLAGLMLVKRAKVVQARRERARVAVRHGEGSERVARLDRQLAMEHGWLVNVRAEADRVRAPILERDDEAWQIHGYLRNQDGLPRAKYQVGLFPDAKGVKDARLTTRSDDSGYFLLQLKLDSVFTPSGKVDVDEAREKAEAARREREASLFVASLKNPVFLGVTVPGQSGPTMDDRAFHPRGGAIAYRDLTVANPKDDGSSCQLPTRLLGNSNSRELHDLDNEKPGCQIAEIRPDNRFFFQNERQAEALGYDFCAYCFGKERSKR